MTILAIPVSPPRESENQVEHVSNKSPGESPNLRSPDDFLKTRETFSAPTQRPLDKHLIATSPAKKNLSTPKTAPVAPSGSTPAQTLTHSVWIGESVSTETRPNLEAEILLGWNMSTQDPMIGQKQNPLRDQKLLSAIQLPHIIILAGTPAETKAKAKNLLSEVPNISHKFEQSIAKTSDHDALSIPIFIKNPGDSKPQLAMVFITLDTSQLLQKGAFNILAATLHEIGGHLPQNLRGEVPLDNKTRYRLEIEAYTRSVALLQSFMDKIAFHSEVPQSEKAELQTVIDREKAYLAEVIRQSNLLNSK